MRESSLWCLVEGSPSPSLHWKYFVYSKEVFWDRFSFFGWNSCLCVSSWCLVVCSSPGWAGWINPQSGGEGSDWSKLKGNICVVSPKHPSPSVEVTLPHPPTHTHTHIHVAALCILWRSIWICREGNLNDPFRRRRLGGDFRPPGKVFAPIPLYFFPYVDTFFSPLHGIVGMGFTDFSNSEAWSMR